MMVLAPSTKYFQNCTFSDWINQFLHIIGLENAKLHIFVPTRIRVSERFHAWDLSWEIRSEGPFGTNYLSVGEEVQVFKPST